MSPAITTHRLTALALAVCAAVVGGCAGRLPRIDPSGQSLFLVKPGPVGSAVEPVPAQPGPLVPTPAVPVAPSGVGEMAVLLSPGVTVAPVGSEVVLLAGVRGPDNYLWTGRRVEWSIAPGSAGHFVAVAKKGAVDFLLGDWNLTRKVDNTFAITSTLRRHQRLDRGTPHADDDVCVLPGQAWVTVTSPVEGTTHVSVYARDVPAWDARTRTATIHWVDAQWRLPAPAINPAGSRHVFTTAVTRQTDMQPCEGWIVRYEIVDGPPAGFAPDGAAAIEVPTDAAGQASVEIFQKQPGPGTNQVAVQIIRPAAVSGAFGRRLTVGGGTTTKTWSAADLAVRVTGPASVGMGGTIDYLIEVSNAGDLPAEDVVVTDQLPEPLQYESSQPQAELSGRTLRWQVGALGAGARQTIQLRCRVGQLGSIAHCVEATAAGGLKASHCATSTAMAAVVDVQIAGPQRASVGQDVSFEIRVTNRSQVAAAGLLIKDRFDTGLEHAVAKSPIERDLGTLAPGASQVVRITFQVARAGRLCHTVEVTGADGIRATAEACLTAEQPPTPQPPIRRQPLQPQPQPIPQPQPVPQGDTEPAPARPQPAAARPEPPSLKVTKTGPALAKVDETARFIIQVTNTGGRPLAGVRVVDSYDAVLQPTLASRGHKMQDNKLVWTIDRLAAGASEQLEVRCRCLKASLRACNRVEVGTVEAVPARAEACLEIRAAPTAALPSAGDAPSATEGAGGAHESRLSLELGDLIDPVRLGKELTYEVRVVNRGTQPEQGLVLEATAPDGMRPVPLGTTGPNNTKYVIDGQRVRFDEVAEIPAGRALSYRIRVSTRNPGRFTFHVRLTSQGTPEAIAAEETTDVFR